MDEITQSYPSLSLGDVEACLQYAADFLDGDPEDLDLYVFARGLRAAS